MNPRMFDIARKMAQKSSYKHQLGAVIVRKGKVLGLGHNSLKTHPRATNPWKMIHAELSAIINSREEDLTDCSIYVYRETPTGRIAPSFPCKYCFQLLKSLNIKEVCYTDYDGYKSEKI
jgi:deoxycytidylate deaminase